MKLSKIYLTLVILPALFLSACGASPLAAVNAPDLPVQLVAVAQSAALQSAAQNSSSIEGLDDLQAVFEGIYADVNPSVVNIQVTVSSSPARFGPQGEETGLGSGFVWDQEGHIVTNAHVVTGASEIQVMFYDGTTVEAELVGSDPYSDLAVLKVDVPAAGAPASQLHPVELADSSQVKVGQIAIAIGNPFGLQNTMTQGIISGLGRSLSVDLTNPISQQAGSYSIPDIIQTDAPINPGNSGGVLVDDQGRLIGVTSAIATTSQSNSGVGFVIPANIAKKFVPELIENGEVRHSWMGISGTTLTPDLAEASNLPANQRGALVLDVNAGSPAQEAGVQGGRQQAAAKGQAGSLGGDLIIAIDGQAVDQFEELISYLYNHTEPGQTVTLTVLRQGNQQDIELTLGVLPAQS